jgi:hypothetical protein
MTERLAPVLRIRDVYSGSEFFPSRIPGQKDSRIPDPDPHQTNLSILKLFLRSRLIFYPSRISDPGLKKAPDPGSGPTTLICTQTRLVRYESKVLFRGTGTVWILTISLNPLRIITFGSATNASVQVWYPNRQSQKFAQKIMARCQKHSEMREQYERPIHKN